MKRTHARIILTFLPQVIQHWGKYLGRISIAVLESIKHNVRTSLTTLSKIVNVDSKSGSVALIGVKVLLKDNKVRQASRERRIRAKQLQNGVAPHLFIPISI